MLRSEVISITRLYPLKVLDLTSGSLAQEPFFNFQIQHQNGVTPAHTYRCSNNFGVLSSIVT